MKPGVLGTVSEDLTVDSIYVSLFCPLFRYYVWNAKKFVNHDRLVGFALQIIARRAIVIETEASRQGDEKEGERNAAGDDNEGCDGTNQE